MLRESPSRKPEVGDCIELASPFFGPAGPEMIQTKKKKNNKNTVKRHIYIKILSTYNNDWVYYYWMLQQYSFTY